MPGQLFNLSKYLVSKNRDRAARDHPRFFDQVGHEIMYAFSGNKHFSLNLVIVRLTKIMNNLFKLIKIRTFKVIFPKKNFYEENFDF